MPDNLSMASQPMAPANPTPRLESKTPSQVLQPDITEAPLAGAGPKKRQIPLNRRQFGDIPAIRRLIYDNVVQQASNIKPVENTRYRLSLHDLEYADPDDFPLSKQKEHILANKTLYRRLRGSWRLTDVNNGNTVDEKKMTIAQIPHMTERGTFIINGTEYTLSHQMRLRPGIFTRVKANNEVEAHVNVMPGQGVSHRYFFEPETGVFRINVGQSKVPLLPVLRAMGVNDKQLRSAWGNELFAINQQYDSPHVIDKLYQRMVRRADPRATHETKAAALSAELQKMELDPEVTKRTLGKPYSKLSSDAILDTTRKLLAVNRREVDADDRDHLAFQNLMGPEDLIAERIGKDRTTLQKLLWHSTHKGNLEHIQPGAFTRSVMASFLSSGLGQAAEEVNAAELVDHQGRITRLGEGGIGDAQAVPEESRNVHPSQMAFVDPVKTPECNPIESINVSYVMVKDGWKAWKDITGDEEFACLINDQLEFHKATHIHTSRYQGKILTANTRSIGYEVTPNHRMWIQPYHSPKAVWRFELAEQVHDRYIRHQIGGHTAYKGNNDIEQFALKNIPGDYKVNLQYDDQYETIYLDIQDWAELLGWYVSEGCLNYSKASKDGSDHFYGIQISQYKEANPESYELIRDLLNRLPFRYSEYASRTGFNINDCRLATYLLNLGRYCYEKTLPEEVFEYPVAARQKLYDALLLGDGRRDRRGRLYAYCTTSEKLANAFLRLAFSLGQSSSISIEPEKRLRKDGTANFDSYIVQLHKETTRTIEDNARAAKINQPIRYESYDYDGLVRCATVPGGMLYLKLNDKGGFWSGNSFKTGVDLRTTFGVQKGTDGRLYAPFKDPKRPGRLAYRSPQELADLTVAFPGELESGRPYVQAMAKGRLSYVPRGKVDLSLPSMENAFSPLSNMVPMKSAVKGQRVSMGARMLSQALPLMNAQTPFVQSAVPDVIMPNGDPVSFEQLYGLHMGVVRAHKGGTVVDVDPDGIKVKHDDGEKYTYQTYNHHPYNRKTYLHNTSAVKAGERFNADDVLATSNYTDNKGYAALGLNARVAYLPFQGKTYEDAAVISESMAKRMMSEHMYQHVADFSSGVHKGKNAFISLFPGEYDRKTLDTMDEHGAVKPGTIVSYGDPLVLMATEKERAHNQVHRGKTGFSNNTITWKHHTPGQVTDVVHTRNGALVAVKAYMPMQVGDKLSGRYGDKGVIADIIPDEQMPHDTQNRPFEILLSPMGLISRINAAQAVEAALGKISEKTGKPYKIEDFSQPNLVQYALDELKKHGMADTEHVIDPATGRHIPDVLTGNRFFMKLHHTSESKSQGRGAGGGFTCFDDQTEVLTKQGWKNWASVEYTDELATVIDNRLEYQRPIKLIKEFYDGELVGFKGRYLDYLVTPNHRMYMQDAKKRYSFTYKTADELFGKRFYVKQFGFERITGTNRSTATIRQKLPKSTHYRIKYTGYVYCANIPAGLLYVRRNGKPILTGNSEGVPSKGGETGSKRISLMDSNALLAHGATDVLKDAHVVRGQRNEQFWMDFMAGLTPPEPKVPFIYEKFLNELKGAGINVVREGHKLNVMALTDKDIDAITEGRELQNAKTVDWKEGLKPMKGGLFDPGLTGGHQGNRWSKISLHEPMPNPVMEEPIRRILGLTEANFLDILAGKKELNNKKGPLAISDALKGIDVTKEIARSRAEIASGRKSLRDAAIRRLQYLESAKKLNIHPKDWILTSVPVLPPAFRPVSLMSGKRSTLISDPNHLYREVWEANENLKGMTGKVDDISEERLNLYNAFKGVTGLGDPIQPKNTEKGVKGILRHIFGTSPKFSTVQFKLLGASVNLVGRGVIIPNPDIDMDSIGLPEHRAWEVYKPFIVRGLVRRGMPRLAALKSVDDKTPQARDVMLDAMKERPVLVNRYPVLHRYGLMAFWPKLVHGETIQVSPIITKGFAADFDGDTMQYHVPASEDARKDAIAKMLPSANLFSGATFKVNYTPNQEYIQGLHAASTAKEGDKAKRTFASKQDALNAYRRGEINLGTPIEIIKQ